MATIDPATTPVVYHLDLDEDLLAHLPSPDSWVVIHGEGLASELIEDDFVREVFLWQKEHIRRHHQPASATVLADQFDLDLRAPEASIGDLIDRLRARYAKNHGRTALREIVELQKQDPIAVPQALLRYGRQLNDLLSTRGEIFGTGDVDRAYYYYEKKCQAGPGASFGHDALDDYFFGQRGLTFTIAPPKRFKSWQMIQGAAVNALQGRTSYLYCLELPAHESDMRLRCLLADIPWWRYIRNQMTTQDWKHIREASEEIDASGKYRIIKPPHGNRSIDEMVHKARDAGAEVIFIDQLQFVENQKGQTLGSLNSTGEYWGAIDRARELSDEGPINIAHQFNRAAMYANEMPPIEMAKGSSAIEEFATVALGMWANRDMLRSSIMHVGTLIARNQTYATWEMGFDLKSHCTFEITRRLDDE